MGIEDPNKMQSGVPISPERRHVFVAVEDLIPDIAPSPDPAAFEKDNELGLADEWAEDLRKAFWTARLYLGNPNYSKDMKDWAEKYLGSWERLCGQRVVDIGAGLHPYGLQIAELCDASCYIGVDKYNANTLREAIEREQSYEPYGIAQLGNFEPETSSIPVAIVKEDALAFLRRVPDGSVSVLASGTELFGGRFFGDRNYQQLIAAEIYRVLDPVGMFVEGQRSTLGHYLEEDRIAKTEMAADPVLPPDDVTFYTKTR